MSVKDDQGRLRFVCQKCGRVEWRWVGRGPIWNKKCQRKPKCGGDLVRSDSEEQDMNMIKVTLLDHKGDHVETSTLMPEEAADKAREFVFLQGSDPDMGGTGATKGTVTFEPVKIDNPAQESKFLAPYHANYETLKRACKNGDLGLMHCTWKRTGSPVAVLVAREKVEGGYNMVPLGMMFVANPYELVVSSWDKEPVTDGDKLLAELHELEGRVFAIRQYLGVAQAAGGWPKDAMALAPFTVSTFVEGGVLNHVEVRDATGAEVPFTHDATDYDEEGGEDDDNGPWRCQDCSHVAPYEDFVATDGGPNRCPNCGRSASIFPHTGDGDGEGQETGSDG